MIRKKDFTIGAAKTKKEIKDFVKETSYISKLKLTIYHGEDDGIFTSDIELHAIDEEDNYVDAIIIQSSEINVNEVEDYDFYNLAEVSAKKILSSKMNSLGKWVQEQFGYSYEIELDFEGFWA